MFRRNLLCFTASGPVLLHTLITDKTITEMLSFKEIKQGCPEWFT